MSSLTCPCVALAADDLGNMGLWTWFSELPCDNTTTKNNAVIYAKDVFSSSLRSSGVARFSCLANSRTLNFWGFFT